MTGNIVTRKIFLLFNELCLKKKLDNFTPVMEDDKNINRPKQKEVAIRLFVM